MKRTFFLSVLLLLGISVFLHLRSTINMVPDTQAPLYLRLATTQSEQFVTNLALSQFCKNVEKASGGQIVITPYYDDTLGDAASALEQCAFGGVDLVRASASEVARYAPLLTALQMPYIYDSDEHLFRVLDGEPGQEVLASLEGTGLVGLQYFYAGYRCFFGTDGFISTQEDMNGLTLDVSASTPMVQLVESWGATAVDLTTQDLALALRSGTVDGGEDSLPIYVDSGLYRLAPYWTYDRHTYNVDVLVISQQTMDLLTQEQQTLLQTCAYDAVEWQRDHWVNAEVRAMMHASRNGCSMRILDDATAQSFQLAAQALLVDLDPSLLALTQSIARHADT